MYSIYSKVDYVYSWLLYVFCQVIFDFLHKMKEDNNKL
jgi:hypothetical protein